jgi:hypothetical protein
VTVSEGQIKGELKESLTRARRDALVFALLTIALTPAFVIIALIVVVCALAFVDLPIIDYFGYGLSFVTGVNLCLSFMIASYFLCPKESDKRQKEDKYFIIVSLVVWICLIALSYGTSLIENSPRLFWTLYLIAVLAMLGCIGYAYEPKKDYYLGWAIYRYGYIDDPFTIEDDIDRAHTYLGFAMAVPYLLMRSYADIFGSTWVWHSFKEREISGAVKLLQALVRGDLERAKGCLELLGEASATKVVRALVKMDMISTDRCRLRLKPNGRDILSQ